MQQNLREHLSTRNLGFLCFALAILMSVKLSRRVAIEQAARNQAQAQESHLRDQIDSQSLIETEQRDQLQVIQKLLESAG